MKKLHVYTVYLEDGNNCFKVTVPAESEKEARNFVSGNGDIITVKDSPLQDIDCNYLADTLRRGGWGQMEIDVITRALFKCGLERI